MEIRFIPEVVVVGPDPSTGLLTRTFTLYYGMGGGSPGDELSLPEGPAGVVRVDDPIQSLPVSRGNRVFVRP